jgi:hypothetical protein
MINPNVGLTVLTSSFMILLTIVVLPALSRPLQDHQQPECQGRLERPDSISTRISLSFRRAFLSIDSIFPTHELLDLIREHNHLF